MQSQTNKSGRYIGNAEFAPALLDPDIETPDGIIGPDGERAPKRFSVYRNNVVVSLLEAVETTFPAVKAVIGAENFATLSRIFIYHYPPKSAMMQGYGEEFPEFVRGFKPLEHVEFLPDLAQFEWHWVEAHHEENADCLPPDCLASIDPDLLMGTRFVKHPATRLITSRFDLEKLISIRDGGEINDTEIDLACAILITRPALQVHQLRLDLAQAEFFNALFKGSTLEAAVDAATTSDENFDPTPAITHMLTSGAFSAFSTNQSSSNTGD